MERFTHVDMIGILWLPADPLGFHASSYQLTHRPIVSHGPARCRAVQSMWSRLPERVLHHGPFLAEIVDPLPLDKSNASVEPGKRTRSVKVEPFEALRARLFDRRSRKRGPDAVPSPFPDDEQVCEPRGELRPDVHIAANQVHRTQEGAARMRNQQVRDVRASSAPVQESRILLQRGIARELPPLGELELGDGVNEVRMQADVLYGQVLPPVWRQGHLRGEHKVRVGRGVCYGKLLADQKPSRDRVNAGLPQSRSLRGWCQPPACRDPSRARAGSRARLWKTRARDDTAPISRGCSCLLAEVAGELNEVGEVDPAVCDEIQALTEGRSLISGTITRLRRSAILRRVPAGLVLGRDLPELDPRHEGCN